MCCPSALQMAPASACIAPLPVILLILVLSPTSVMSFPLGVPKLLEDALSSSAGKVIIGIAK